MNAIRILGSAAVLLIVVGLAGILASLVTENGLFLGTGDVAATPALATLLVFLVAVVVFVAVGRPWGKWDRTAYW